MGNLKDADLWLDLDSRLARGAASLTLGLPVSQTPFPPLPFDHRAAAGWTAFGSVLVQARIHPWCAAFNWSAAGTVVVRGRLFTGRRKVQLGGRLGLGTRSDGEIQLVSGRALRGRRTIQLGSRLGLGAGRGAETSPD